MSDVINKTTGILGDVFQALDSSGNSNNFGESMVRGNTGIQGGAMAMQAYGGAKTARLGGLLATKNFATKALPLAAIGSGVFDAGMGVSQDDQGFLSQMGTGGYQFADGATGGIAGKALDHFGYGEDGKSYGQIITENEDKSKKYEASSKEYGSFNEAKRDRWATMSESEQAASQEREAALTPAEKKERSAAMKELGSKWTKLSAQEQETALEDIQGKQGPVLSNLVGDAKDAGSKGLDKIKSMGGFDKVKDMFLDKDGKLTGWGAAGILGGGALAATAAFKLLDKDEPEIAQQMPMMAPVYAQQPQYVQVPVAGATLPPQQDGMTFG